MKDNEAKFKATMLEVDNLDESMAMLVMKRGLYNSYFTYLLDKTHAKSYFEMLARA